LGLREWARALPWMPQPKDSEGSMGLMRWLYRHAALDDEMRRSPKERDAALPNRYAHLSAFFRDATIMRGEPQPELCAAMVEIGLRFLGPLGRVQAHNHVPIRRPPTYMRRLHKVLGDMGLAALAREPLRPHAAQTHASTKIGSASLRGDL
jgi:hypothetical protein